jgi:hypothetical protein
LDANEGRSVGRRREVVQESEILLTIAEIAVAFAGFSSIVVVFRNREVEVWESLDTFRYQGMLAGSLATAALATVPLVVFWLSVPSHLVWRVSSGVLFVWFLLVILSQLRFRSLFPALAGKALFFVFFSTSVATAIALALNSTGMAFQGTAGTFLIGITWTLILSGWQFFQLVSLPPGAGDEPAA